MMEADESLTSLLDQLHDIVEPAPVSMWPATPAWAVLGFLLLAAVALGARAWIRHRRATAYRRAALAELDALAPALIAGETGALAGLEVLLRRTALAAFPRAEVAALDGPDWPAFLDRTGGHFAALGPALMAAAYAPRPPDFDGRAALAAARHWIGHHHA